MSTWQRSITESQYYSLPVVYMDHYNSISRFDLCGLHCILIGGNYKLLRDLYASSDGCYILQQVLLT